MRSLSELQAWTLFAKAFKEAESYDPAKLPNGRADDCICGLLSQASSSGLIDGNTNRKMHARVEAYGQSIGKDAGFLLFERDRDGKQTERYNFCRKQARQLKAQADRRKAAKAARATVKTKAVAKASSKPNKSDKPSKAKTTKSKAKTGAR